MKKAPNRPEKRSYPRFFLDLPLEYRDSKEILSRGGLVVNVSEGGALIESVKSLPLDTQLNIVILFPNGFELTGLKLVTKVVWKEPIFKEDWEGYQYGLRIIQVMDEDPWKRTLILKGQLGRGEMDRFNEGIRKPRVFEEGALEIRDRPFMWYKQ